MTHTYDLHTTRPELDATTPVTLNGITIGTITCCNVSRPLEPQHLKYYGKAAVGAATGGSWDEPTQALADVLAWHLHRPALEQQSFYGTQAST
ncbi:hypothetical protein ACW9KT_09950 [Hymenobacter sp. HD11105]|jgi:hypothetical protein